jgi:chemotaxis protein histidine kinase CheA
MTERKRKLRARFRAAALEELARAAPVIAELRGGAGRPEAARELGRALHTLKGDAALVGMPEISAALHAAEDRAVEGTWDALAEALDAIARELAHDGGEPAGAGAAGPAPVTPT